MSIEALPYTLLLLLGQFAAGCAFVVLFAQFRGGFEASFLRTSAWLIVSSAILALLTVAFLQPKTDIDGFRLDDGILTPLRAALAAMTLFSIAYALFLRRAEDDPFLSHATGATTGGLGVAVLVLMAQLVHLPIWSIAGALLTLVAGAVTLGAVTVAMIWGHWYLVNPRLSEKPLNEMTLLTLGALLVELVMTAINAAIPVGQHIASNALLAVSLPQNPAFWLRIGVGLIFPAALAFMAYKSSEERAMMSATGLLYIAVGAVLAGEALGRGLLFVTAAPV